MSAVIAAFFKWLFLKLFGTKRNITFKDVLWGKNKKVSFLDYDMSLSFYGIVIIIIILYLLMWLIRK